jgi:hypothetical protein
VVVHRLLIVRASLIVRSESRRVHRVVRLLGCFLSRFVPDTAV